MGNYKIHTTLNIAPAQAGCHCGHFFTVVRGASAEFTFDFGEYTYLKAGWGEPWYKYIEQMYFIFKHDTQDPYADTTPIKFQLFTERKSDQEFDPEEGPETTDYCKYDPERDCISLLIGANATAGFNLADRDEPYRFEIAIDTDTYDSEGHMVLEQSTDAIIIEPQDPVVVTDSLYREIMPKGE